jgi:RNA polymerase sigma-70 factor, ECF subfamily
MTSEEYALAYERGFNTVVRFFLSRGVSYDQAVESVQAAWVRGWERRHQLRQPDAVLPWIISIARNLRNTDLREREHAPVEEASTVTCQTVHLSAIDARRVLDRSKPGERTVLEARYVQGFTVREIAEAEGISKVAVRLRTPKRR